MVRGLYTAGTGMLTQKSKMDVIANNIANIETVGYKQDSLLSRSFKEMMIERINDPSIVRQNEIIGSLNKGIHIDEIYINFEQGTFKETNRNLDLALIGDGFFMVETPNGVRYTREGNFNIDENGMLVSNKGHYVLGEEGTPINIGTNDFVVSADGSIYTGEEYDNYIGKINIVSFAENSVLRKEGEGLYSVFGDSEPIESNAKVKQGSLEVSNVDMVQQIVDMIEVSRTYESNQRIISMIDDTLGKAVNEVGKI